METLKTYPPAHDVKSAGDLPPALPQRQSHGFWQWLAGFSYLLNAAFIILAVLGGLKAAQFMKLGAMKAAGAFDPPPAMVTTAVVHAASWQPTLRAIGSLEAVQGVTVSADLPGIVKEIRFESGATVRQGDILVRLNIDAEQAQLDAAQAQRDISMLNLNRQKDLRTKNANSQSDFDNAEATERQMEAMVANGRAAIDRKTIRAPFNGVLGIRRASLGQYLNSGDPVVSLQSMDPIYANFTLPQQNLRDFTVGSVVEVRTDATGDTLFKGKVTAINALVDSATRNFQAQATIANPEGKLRPGMFANVEVILGDEKPVLPVPGSAVAYAPYGNAVYVIEHNVKIPRDQSDPDSKEKVLPLAVRQQFVKLGQAKGDVVAITSGLKEGEEIVTSGVFKLQNNAPVKINNDVKPGAEEHPKPEES